MGPASGVAVRPRWATPLALALVLAAAMVPAVAGGWLVGGNHVLGNAGAGIHSDLGATWWFYAWVDRALGRGLPLGRSTWTCFPVGESLGNRFANPVDAILAVPLTRAWGAYRAAWGVDVAAPVLNALAAWIWLRASGAAPLPAVVGAALFGTSGAVMDEITGGRPVTALHPWLPLAAAPWVLALRTRSTPLALVGAALAGLAGTLAFAAYAPWLLWVVGGALVHAGLRSLWPAPGLPRWRALLVLLLAGLVLWLSSRGYLADLRARLPPDMGASTGALLRLQAHPGAVRPDLLHLVQDRSMVVDWPFRPSDGRGTEIRELPVLVLAPAGLALLLRPRRSAPWLFGAAAAWLFTLGPVAMVRLRPEQVPLDLGGFRFRLPVDALLRQLPGIAEHLRPERGSVVVIAMVGGLLAHALTGMGRGRRARLGQALAVGVLLVAVGVQAAHRGRQVPVLEVDPPAIYGQLDALPQEAFLELPLARDAGYGAWQADHGHPLANSVLVNPSEPAASCMHPTVRALLDMELRGPAVRRAQLDQAGAAGIRWLVLHPWRYGPPDPRRLDAAQVQAELESILGPPDRVVPPDLAWRLGPAAP